MFHLQPCVILAAVVLGNCGFWLFCVNRVNAIGWERRTTKTLERACIITCFVLPTLIAYREWQPLLTWIGSQSGEWWPAHAPWFNSYGAWCVACTIVLGAMWLESRWWILPPKNLLEQKSERYRVHDAIAGGSPGDSLTSFLNVLPGNEIGDLQVTRKHLRLPRFIKGVEGFRIGHLSDLHFTGQLRQPHYQFVMDRLMELEPDLVIISGDIIDSDDCLSWIEPVLGRLSAPRGCAFVLGNHDRRLRRVDQLLSSLTDLGHVDLGQSSWKFKLDSGTQIELMGNEQPWFDRHPRHTTLLGDAGSQSAQMLRIGVSHSPDQLPWARKHRLDLMLAGHTHGGQVRFPCIGPIVAPSWHGSRFASGVFYHAPTLMHVSRGVAGTHPLRWRCAPEVSLLTLQT